MAKSGRTILYQESPKRVKEKGSPQTSRPSGRSSHLVKRLAGRSTKIRDADSTYRTGPGELSWQWKQFIEACIEEMESPSLFQGKHSLGKLSDLHFQLELDGGVLVCIFRVDHKMQRRRIVGVEESGVRVLELTFRRLKTLETFTLRSGTGGFPAGVKRQIRLDFQKQIESLIIRNFSKAKIHRSSLYSDLAHSISGKYVRLLFNSGLASWAALAVSPDEDQTTVDGILSSGIIWRNNLQDRTANPTGRLLLMVPASRALVLKSRLGLIPVAGHKILLMEFDLIKQSLIFQDLSDSGNLDTALTLVHSPDPKSDFTRSESYQRITNLAPGRIRAVFRAGSNTVSFRIHGLEFAQIQMSGSLEGRILCGVERLEPLEDWQQLTHLVNRILKARHPSTGTRKHEYFRLQAERWLESLILENIQQIDPRLHSSSVYPQVPAFLGGDRGMIDILTVTRRGRLAVLELKVVPDIELPLQGLDYWLRVRWHQARGEFQQKGYFRGLELSPEPPILYYISPQFCYHDTFPQILSQIDRSVPLVQVGINEDWRDGIQVVQRREWNRPF